MAVIGGRAHTLEEICEVGKLGYPYAEINIDHPEKIEQQLGELKALKEEYGFYYLAHYPNEGNPSDVKGLQEKFIPKMKRLFEFSPVLGIRKGTMHFWMDKRWAKPELIAEKIKMLSELVAHASRNDMVLCLENLTAQHDSFSAYFDAVPDLRMTMDIGHGELLSERNTSFGFMEHVFDKIEHVHVHDNRGGTGVKDDLHLALGEGVVDYPQILTILKEKGYDSTITLEVKPPDMKRTQKAVEQYI
ncbi:MAG: sugar phosphate isomerase/epimerase [Proteobacteria bacterium]|nr:sugar phosphate isomerase/epimerase [Pseudomonadota bacterium]